MLRDGLISESSTACLGRVPIIFQVITSSDRVCWSSESEAVVGRLALSSVTNIRTLSYRCTLEVGTGMRLSVGDCLIVESFISPSDDALSSDYILPGANIAVNNKSSVLEHRRGQCVFDLNLKMSSATPSEGAVYGER